MQAIKLNGRLVPHSKQTIYFFVNKESDDYSDIYLFFVSYSLSVKQTYIYIIIFEFSTNLCSFS